MGIGEVGPLAGPEVQPWLRVILQNTRPERCKQPPSWEGSAEQEGIKQLLSCLKLKSPAEEGGNVVFRDSRLSDHLYTCVKITLPT